MAEASVEPDSTGDAPRLPHASPPSRPGFFAGLRYPFRGARFVFREHPRLFKFWLPPILITVAAVAAVAWLALEWRGELLAGVWTAPTGQGWLDILGRYVHIALGWVLAIGIFLVGVVAVALLSSVVAAPFNDALSEAVEVLRGAATGSPVTLARMLGDLRRTLSLECAKLAIYLAIMLPLFVASLLVPGVGPALYTVAAFYFTAMYFAIDYVDWPASRRGFGVRRRLAILRQNFAAMLGFGVGVWLFMYVPLLNLLFMPGAVAGGTLLFLDLHGLQENPDDRGEAPAAGSGGPEAGCLQKSSIPGELSLR